ncbi:hypothetical protein L3C95_33065 [Chitinophaga filiformis]|uniref:hypothetical protein n=1 Tax=Chitinophaga filiformis TaxID=104663 RepID=UPI001F41D823|nr:hypothetical protein [Chitinophaga filiformis]MCF6407765.1 hypothetical protein [Chitinophaga filiformis]
MITAPDRIEALLAQSRVTGIDFVYIHTSQLILDVYFLRSPSTLDVPVTGTLTPDQIRIYNPAGTVPDMPVSALSWITVDAQDVLRLTVPHPGDFTLYRLYIDDPRVDLFYNDITFSFKANCPSDLDCKPAEHECPPEEPVDFPVNYLARDFWSFRQSLLDFASQRYPDWPDRLEADAGVMLTEAMSALGDEMAYYQDKVGREAYLETATQRRSLRRHALLVDYNIHDGLGATSWLDVTVAETGSGVIPAGTDVWASGENGSRIDFEVGRGLQEVFAGKTYAVDADRNDLLPHLIDEDKVCLPVGATDMYIQGHHEAHLTPFDDLPEDQAPGKWVLLQTIPTNPAQRARVHLVRLIAVTDTTDPVLDEDITHLVWESAQALPFEMDLTVLHVRGNILPVTAGKTHTLYFLTGAEATALSQTEQDALKEAAQQAVVPTADSAVERNGREGEVTYLCSLPLSADEPLVWLGDDPHDARPEIRLTSVVFNGTCWVPDEEWTWRRSLLGEHSSQSQDRDYTLDDGTWKRVVGYQRIGEEVIHRDYASGGGVTIRFGDGEFGLIPARGTVFRVDYRLGGGRRGNVPEASLKYIKDDRQPGDCDPPLADLSFIKSVTNPLQGLNGIDPEKPDEVRQSAPEAFRALTYRAVRPEDYAEAAERLPWVQRAGSVFRWTGSWLSAFVTPDPLGTVGLEPAHRNNLQQQLDRFRQAGREALIQDPVYADMDIEIEICAAPHAYAGEVKALVLEALLGKGGINPVPGYFSPDHFTFGTPLERSSLEAHIQQVPGVQAIEYIRFRRRGWFGWKMFTDLSYDPGQQTIIRVENDPLFPERGSLKIYIHGGA